jgi:hypothetical protein
MVPIEASRFVARNCECETADRRASGAPWSADERCVGRRANRDTIPAMMASLSNRFLSTWSHDVDTSRFIQVGAHALEQQEPPVEGFSVLLAGLHGMAYPARECILTAGA